MLLLAVKGHYHPVLLPLVLCKTFEHPSLTHSKEMSNYNGMSLCHLGSSQSQVKEKQSNLLMDEKYILAQIT